MNFSSVSRTLVLGASIFAISTGHAGDPENNNNNNAKAKADLFVIDKDNVNVNNHLCSMSQDLFEYTMSFLPPENMRNIERVCKILNNKVVNLVNKTAENYVLYATGQTDILSLVTKFWSNHLKNKPLFQKVLKDDILKHIDDTGFLLLTKDAMYHHLIDNMMIYKDKENRLVPYGVLNIWNSNPPQLYRGLSQMQQAAISHVLSLVELYGIKSKGAPETDKVMENLEGIAQKIVKSKFSEFYFMDDTNGEFNELTHKYIVCTDDYLEQSADKLTHFDQLCKDNPNATVIVDLQGNNKNSPLEKTPLINFTKHISFVNTNELVTKLESIILPPKSYRRQFNLFNTKFQSFNVFSANLNGIYKLNEVSSIDLQLQKVSLSLFNLIKIGKIDFFNGAKKNHSSRIILPETTDDYNSYESGRMFVYAPKVTKISINGFMNNRLFLPSLEQICHISSNCQFSEETREFILITDGKKVFIGDGFFNKPTINTNMIFDIKTDSFPWKCHLNPRYNEKLENISTTKTFDIDEENKKLMSNRKRLLDPQANDLEFQLTNCYPALNYIKACPPKAKIIGIFACVVNNVGFSYGNFTNETQQNARMATNRLFIALKPSHGYKHQESSYKNLAWTMVNFDFNSPSESFKRTLQKLSIITAAKSGIDIKKSGIDIKNHLGSQISIKEIGFFDRLTPSKDDSNIWEINKANKSRYAVVSLNNDNESYSLRSPNGVFNNILFFNPETKKWEYEPRYDLFYYGGSPYKTNSTAKKVPQFTPDNKNPGEFDGPNPIKNKKTTVKGKGKSQPTYSQPQNNNNNSIGNLPHDQLNPLPAGLFNVPETTSNIIKAQDVAFQEALMMDQETDRKKQLAGKLETEISQMKTEIENFKNAAVSNLKVRGFDNLLRTPLNMLSDEEKENVATYNKLMNELYEKQESLENLQKELKKRKVEKE